MPRRLKRRLGWPPPTVVAIVITLVGITSGYYGFSKLSPDRDWSSNLYLALQLVTLESGAVETDQWPVMVGRWLAPIGTFSALLAVFASRLGRSLARFGLGLRLRLMAPPHYLVFGSGTDGLHVARTLVSRKVQRGDKKMRKAIVVVDRVITEDLRRDLRHEGIYCVALEGLNFEIPDWLRPGSAQHLYIALPEDEENLSLSMSLAVTLGIKEGGQPRISALVRDDRRAGILEDGELWKPGSPIRQIRIINRPRTMARRLLLEVPLETYETIDGVQKSATSVHLVLGSSDRWSEAILRHALTQAHYPGCARLRVHLVGPAATQLRASLLDAIPKMEECADVVHHTCHDAEWVDTVWNLIHAKSDTAELDTSAWTVVPGFNDNLHANHRGLHLASLTKDKISIGRVRVVVGYDGNGLLAGLWHGTEEVDGRSDVRAALAPDTQSMIGRCLHVEALDDSATDARMDFGERLDPLAVYLHEEWLAERLKSPEPPPTAVPWAELSEERRGSNRSAADHIWVKLRAVAMRTKDADLQSGIDLLLRQWLRVDRTANDQLEWAMKRVETAWQQLDPSFREELARCEHNRWWADRLVTGWQSDGMRNDARRRHTDLVAFEDLNPSKQDQDRDQVDRVPLSLRAVLEKALSANMK